MRPVPRSKITEMFDVVIEATKSPNWEEMDSRASFASQQSKSGKSVLVFSNLHGSIIVNMLDRSGIKFTEAWETSAGCFLKDHDSSGESLK